MNERIQALAVEAFFDEATDVVSDKIYTFNEEKMQKFAELIVKECLKLNSKELSITAIERLLPLYREHFGIDE
jgi:hypothetical protein